MNNYEQACDWWLGWNQPVWPVFMLPNEYVKVGQVCILWLYLPISGRAAWLGPMVTDPNSNKKFRQDCIKEAIKMAKYYAHDKGYDILLGCTGSPSLVQHYVDNGFIPAGHYSTEMVGATWQ